MSGVKSSRRNQRQRARYLWTIRAIRSASSGLINSAAMNGNIQQSRPEAYRSRKNFRSLPAGGAEACPGRCRRAPGCSARTFLGRGRDAPKNPVPLDDLPVNPPAASISKPAARISFYLLGTNLLPGRNSEYARGPPGFPPLL